jgi:hypothetical protein
MMAETRGYGRDVQRTLKAAGGPPVHSVTCRLQSMPPAQNHPRANLRTFRSYGREFKTHHLPRMAGPQNVFVTFKALEAVLQREIEGSRGPTKEKPLYSSPYLSRTGNSRPSGPQTAAQTAPDPSPESGSLDIHTNQPCAASKTAIRLAFTRWVRACADRMEHQLGDAVSDSGDSRSSDQ